MLRRVFARRADRVRHGHWYVRGVAVEVNQVTEVALTAAPKMTRRL
jgi:hypothetical protein